MNIRGIKGFTILELIVVITIISIIGIALFVLVSTSRGEGGDAGVKQNLVNARSQISTFFLDNNSTYVGACAQERILRMIQSAVRAGNRTPSSVPYTNTDVGDFDSEACHTTATAWVVQVPLRDSTVVSPRMWCIDSNNASREVTTNLASNATQCP